MWRLGFRFFALLFVLDSLCIFKNHSFSLLLFLIESDTRSQCQHISLGSSLHFFILLFVSIIFYIVIINNYFWHIDSLTTSIHCHDLEWINSNNCYNNHNLLSCQVWPSSSLHYAVSSNNINTSFSFFFDFFKIDILLCFVCIHTVHTSEGIQEELFGSKKD